MSDHAVPPAFGPPATATERPTPPPVLYLPLARTSSPEETRVEIRELKDGRLAVLAYTALDRLATLCGENQPWVLVKTAELGDIKARQPFDVVIFDMEVPVQYRRDGAIA
ncbi:SAV_915 family protein [Litorihabitans aurantiacus]|uniref:SseB protein N-terminal domain-containing protein n=1 Tax=Litorihabitans aurantiacus TaxID=1930061 RepID=A0AA37XHP2_9MICO|nr:SAV_915 family protein [Litorihabitans aurantiacus]GMA33314.1 hypothetical protein GCM10025875_33060 [Litorihabitans aurantiacus]